MASLCRVEATGKHTFKLIYYYSIIDGLYTVCLTSVAELKSQLEPNLCVDELRFHLNCVMSRELLEALKGMTVKRVCVMPASFESHEVYKAFLNVIAKTEVIMLTATLPDFDDVRQVQPFIACRCLDLGEDIHACDRMGWTKENIIQWLHIEHQWDNGVRVMTIHVEPKQAAEIAQYILKEFDNDKESHSFEMHIHATSEAFNGLQHIAINTATGDVISVNYSENTLRIKRNLRTFHYFLIGTPGAAQVVPAKIIYDML